MWRQPYPAVVTCNLVTIEDPLFFPVLFLTLRVGVTSLNPTTRVDALTDYQLSLQVR